MDTMPRSPSADLSRVEKGGFFGEIRKEIHISCVRKKRLQLNHTIKKSLRLCCEQHLNGEPDVLRGTSPVWEEEVER